MKMGEEKEGCRVDHEEGKQGQVPDIELLRTLITSSTPGMGHMSLYARCETFSNEKGRFLRRGSVFQGSSAFREVDYYGNTVIGTSGSAMSWIATG